MTSHVGRVFARAGAATALAAGALVAFGGPAYADDTADLAVSLTGTTLAATTSGKPINVTIKNNGPAKAAGVVVTFDLSQLDQSKVAFEVPDSKACEAQGNKVACGIVDVGVGTQLDLPVKLTRKAGTGKAGSLTVAVSHKGTDNVAANNSAKAAVEVAGSGPDLYLFAPDAPFNPKTLKVGSVAPGGTAKLLYEAGNVGDETVSGVRLAIRLPKHVTFVEREQGCTYDAAMTVAKCTYKALPMVPADKDTDPNDQIFSAYLFAHLVKVAAAAPTGTLTDGSVAVEGLGFVVEGPSLKRATAPNSLPDNVDGIQLSPEVDPTDNVDEFGVVVADTSGGGGGLPVTGSRTAAFGGAGLGVLVVGGILLLLARRRRLVLMTPKDEVPTA